MALNSLILGLQWGDEGKGKIVDALSEKVHAVCRFQGGHNAGHTLVVDGKTYKLSLLPSGIVRGGKLSIIGNGVVIDPWALFSEINQLKSLGVDVGPDNLRIAENAVLILPLHQDLDAARENSAGIQKIGTTGRGIGPAYEDKVGRRAIRVMDLQDLDQLDVKVERLLHHHNLLRKGYGLEALKNSDVIDKLKEIKDLIIPYIDSTWLLMDKLRREGKQILFEGAQGILLDIDFGTYPYVTSSNTVAAQAAIGSGIGPKSIDYVLGITKAYTTRVGNGPFPTELDDEVGQRLGEVGNEFGTVTGRTRRCGWFDAALVRQTTKVAGITGIALTKLDVLDGFEELKICTGYKLNGKIIDYLPSSEQAQRNVEPIYITLSGWKESTKGARSWSDLPAQAVKYVREVESLIEVPIAVLSTSPEREDTILVKDPFSR